MITVYVVVNIGKKTSKNLLEMIKDNRKLINKKNSPNIKFY